MTRKTMSGLVAAGLALAGAAGCDDGQGPGSSRSYTVERSDDWLTERAGTRVVTRGSIRVGGRPVAVTLESDEAKGPNAWRVETRTLDGQRVELRQDDKTKTLVVTVDDASPITVRMRPDGKYHYGRTTFRDTADGRWDLAALIADDLERRRVRDESVVAVGEAQRLATTRLAGEHRAGKLFLAFAFVDVMANVQSNLGIAVGNDIDQTQSNQ